MALAGRTAEAGRIPGQRVGVETVTSDSSTFTTTETEVMAATASVVAGRTYRVRAFTKWRSTESDNQVTARLREDTSAGNIIQSDNVILRNTSTLGFGSVLEVDWTASSSGDKTFVITGIRNSGGGTYTLTASVSRPCSMTVTYEEG